MSLLIESALKMSVILLAALFAGVLLKTRSASLRHWVLAVAVGCAVATPLLSLVLPSSLRAAVGEMSFGQGARGMSPLQEGAMLQDAARNGVAVQTEFSVAGVADASLENLGARHVARHVWVLGTVVSFFILLVGLGRLWWLASRARVIDSGPWFELGAGLHRSYRLSRPVQLLQSDHSSLLVTWGWRHPKVMLPAAARGWANDRVRIVLAHELAHIERGDWAVQLAAEALRSVYWFNPLVWITCRRLRVESERACDDAVLRCGVEGPEYATHLLDLVRSLQSDRGPWLPAPAMARPSSLEGRICAMLNTAINRRPVSWPARVATIVALLALTVPVAGVRAQSTFYSFTGTVLDATNRVLPDTTLVLTDPMRRAKYEVRSDATGRFEFVGLPPGQYTLVAALPGFANFKEDVAMGGNIERELRLQVGSLEETITVTDRSVPAAQPDPVAAQKLEEARRRFAEFAQRERARCAAGVAHVLVGGNILAPRKLLDVRPVYPGPLREANVGGTVTMRALIGIDGMVREVRSVQGPHPDLEAAAVDAVHQWQFSTTLLNCEPIEVDMNVTVNFNPRSR
jgi:TonB family protein